MKPEEFHKRGLTLESICSNKTIRNLRALARVIYKEFSQKSELHRYCSPTCRRKGRCLYLQPDKPAADDNGQIVYNLRERDMPVCLAWLLDENEYEWFRGVVLIALR